MPFDRTFDSFAPLLDQDSRALLSIATHRISIRLPRVGWDHFAHLLGTMMDYFNPPVWGRTAGVSINVCNALISIHPPRTGWDIHCRSAARKSVISIHPPRVGWDCGGGVAGALLWDFNPPTPCGVGLFGSCNSSQALICISIHPPRVGWDSRRFATSQTLPRFQSTHPVWGGTLRVAHHLDHLLISIHPPRVGWDDAGEDRSGASAQISIHPPRVGWDA